MINALEMLEMVINDSNFNLTQEFELVQNFEDLNEDKIGNDILKSCEVVIGNSGEDEDVSRILVKKFKNYDGMDTVNNTKVCGQKADAVYALTNMSGEVFYFLTWLIY